MNEPKRAWVGSGRYLVNHIIIRLAFLRFRAGCAGGSDISLWAMAAAHYFDFPYCDVLLCWGVIFTLAA